MSSLPTLPHILFPHPLRESLVINHEGTCSEAAITPSDRPMIASAISRLALAMTQQAVEQLVIRHKKPVLPDIYHFMTHTSTTKFTRESCQRGAIMTLNKVVYVFSFSTVLHDC